MSNITITLTQDQATTLVSIITAIIEQAIVKKKDSPQPLATEKVRHLTASLAGLRTASKKPSAKKTRTRRIAPLPEGESTADGTGISLA